MRLASRTSLVDGLLVVDDCPVSSSVSLSESSLLLSFVSLGFNLPEWAMAKCMSESIDCSSVEGRLLGVCDLSLTPCNTSTLEATSGTFEGGMGEGRDESCSVEVSSVDSLGGRFIKGRDALLLPDREPEELPSIRLSCDKGRGLALDGTSLDGEKS